MGQSDYSKISACVVKTLTPGAIRVNPFHFMLTRSNAHANITRENAYSLSYWIM